MNGKFRIGVLALIGITVMFGAAGSIFAHENSGVVIGLCTLVCVSLLTLLQQGTAVKLDDVAKDAAVRQGMLTELKDQTDGLTKALVKKSEKVAFDAGRDLGAAEGHTQHRGDTDDKHTRTN